MKTKNDELFYLNSSYEICSGFQRSKDSMATRGSPGCIECYMFVKWMGIVCGSWRSKDSIILSFYHSHEDLKMACPKSEDSKYAFMCWEPAHDFDCH